MSAKVYIETLGSTMNVADTERASTGLRRAGYELVPSADTADVILFNTCSVRERAAQKVYTRIGEVRKLNESKPPLIGLMGCVAQLEGEAILDNSSAVNIVIGTRPNDRISSL